MPSGINGSSSTKRQQKHANVQDSFMDDSHHYSKRKSQYIQMKDEEIQCKMEIAELTTYLSESTAQERQQLTKRHHREQCLSPMDQIQQAYRRNSLQRQMITAIPPSVNYLEGEHSINDNNGQKANSQSKSNSMQRRRIATANSCQPTTTLDTQRKMIWDKMVKTTRGRITYDKGSLGNQPLEIDPMIRLEQEDDTIGSKARNIIISQVDDIPEYKVTSLEQEINLSQREVTPLSKLMIRRLSAPTEDVKEVGDKKVQPNPDMYPSAQQIKEETWRTLSQLKDIIKNYQLDQGQKDKGKIEAASKSGTVCLVQPQNFMSQRRGSMQNRMKMKRYSQDSTASTFWKPNTQSQVDTMLEQPLWNKTQIYDSQRNALHTQVKNLNRDLPRSPKNQAQVDKTKIKTDDQKLKEGQESDMIHRKHLKETFSPQQKKRTIISTRVGGGSTTDRTNNAFENDVATLLQDTTTTDISNQNACNKPNNHQPIVPILNLDCIKYASQSVTTNPKHAAQCQSVNCNPVYVADVSNYYRQSFNHAGVHQRRVHANISQQVVSGSKNSQRVSRVNFQQLLQAKNNGRERCTELFPYNPILTRQSLDEVNSQGNSNNKKFDTCRMVDKQQ